MNEVIKDFELKMNIKVLDKDIKIYSEGATDAIVFSIKDEYLIKKTSKLELDVYNEFFSKYKGKRYQRLYYINYDLSYVCISFIKGNKYDNSIDVNDIVKILYDTTSNYKEIDYDGYGYLFEDHKTWDGFLKDEVEYSLNMLDENIFNDNDIRKCIDIISKYKVDKYLLHGDFGTHNFIINNGDLFYIDPMGLVGDPIYDFYFAIFSNVSIFSSLKMIKLLEYFDRDIEYKKSIIYITYIIRMCRAYKYDKDNYDIYLEYYRKNIVSLFT